MENQHQIRTPGGILAEKPADFAYASLLYHPEEYQSTPEYTMTNRGLKLANGLGLRILGLMPTFCPYIVQTYMGVENVHPTTGTNTAMLKCRFHLCLGR